MSPVETGFVVGGLTAALLFLALSISQLRMHRWCERENARLQAQWHADLEEARRLNQAPPPPPNRWIPG